MYVSEFVCGVIATLIVEVAALIIIAIKENQK